MAALSTLFLALVISFPGAYSTDQPSSGNAIFTITVAPPESAKDVQLRYVLTDQAGGRWSSTAITAKDDKIAIQTENAAQSPKTFNAIAYAPGCEFVTFTVDDVSAAPAQGDYQCRKLPTVPVRGKITLPPNQQQALDVEAMYVVRWAGKFFKVPGLSMSPLWVNRSSVDTNGSFAMDLPDFSADPLWNSFSKDATLMFFLVDRATGHRVADLRAPAPLSKNGNLKVAANYPEVAFTIRQSRVAATQAKAAQ